MNFRAHILTVCTDPNFAILLLLTGVLLLYAEFNRPGTVLLGCLGVLAAMFGVYGLSHLPLNPYFAALGFAGMALITAGIRFPWRGLFAVLGTACLLFALAHLVIKPHANPLLAIGVACIFGAVTTSLGSITRAARRNKARSGFATLSPRGAAGQQTTPRRVD